MKKRARAESWTAEELAHHLRKLCGTEFRVGDVETAAAASTFWVMLPVGETEVRLARVRITPDLTITVEMRGKARGLKTETLFQDSLRFAAAKATPKST